MGWHYNSGVYQGIVANIEGESMKKLFDFIDSINEDYKLNIEIITNEGKSIYEISYEECFIYIERERYRDEHYSYSSMSSMAKDDYGNDMFPRYFKKFNKEYSLSEIENVAFSKIQEYFGEYRYDKMSVYKMGVVEY